MGTSGFTGVLVRAVLFALWLPVVVLVVSLLRFGLEGMVTHDGCHVARAAGCLRVA